MAGRTCRSCPNTGLIAEEVAQVAPELVAPDLGQAVLVKYQLLPSLLLGQVQRQERKIDEQESTSRGQQVEIRALTARWPQLEALYAGGPSAAQR